MALTDNLVFANNCNVVDQFEDQVGTNHGTVNGAVYDNDSDLHGCFDYDGSDDYIQLPAATNILGRSGSIEMVIKPDDLNVGRRLFDERSSSGATARVVNAGKISFIFWDSSSTYQTVETGALTNGTAYHIVLTWDTSALTLYVDGSQVATTSFGGLDSAYRDDGVNIGRPRDSLSKANYFWNGKIGFTRIWSDALSSSDVSSLYNSGNYKVYNHITGSFEDTDDLRSGLQCYLTLNGDTTDIISGAAVTNDGAVVNSDGKSAQCYSFDGTNDTIKIADVSDSTESAGAISVWFRTSDTGVQALGGWYNSSDTSGVAMRIFLIFGNITGAYSDETLTLQVFNASGSLLTTALIRDGDGAYQDGNWHHLVIGSTGTSYFFYVDGVDKSSKVTYKDGSNDGDWKDGSNDASDFLIGARRYNNAYDLHFNGDVEELALYDREVTSTEVTNLYNSGKAKIYDIETDTFIDGDETRIGVYSANLFDSSTTTSKNLTVRPHEYEHDGCTYTSSGKINGAFDYDGVDDYSNADFNYNLLDYDITISQWVNPDSNLDEVMYVYYFDNTNYVQLINSNGKLVVNGKFGSSTEESIATSDVVLTTGVFYHIMITIPKNDLSNATIYINNISKTTTAGSTGYGIGTNQGVTIGANNSFGSYNYDGIIDEPVIWTRIINSTDRSNVYNNGNGNQYPFTSTTPSTGWSHDFLGISNSDISTINGVSLSDITSINGIS